MRVLAATDTVHTAASICDYLEPRVGAEDTVLAVGVAPAGSEAARDCAEAFTVVRVRLPAPEIETAIRDGDPAEALIEAATAHDVDEIVLGARGGTTASAADLGSTARGVLSAADRPVVVLPGVDFGEDC